tara:strand:- start:344 stop:523 length:180 start_codon:yes stop_codon:yes gene_type:complete
MKILVKEFREMIKSIIEQELDKLKKPAEKDDEGEEVSKGQELKIDIEDDPFVKPKRKKY